MIGLQLVETDVDLIQAQIKNNIAAALAAVRSQRNDPVVTTEPPRDYYIYPKPKGYRTPAVFIIPDRLEFMKHERGANHINAVSRINITVLIEDKHADLIAIKAWRYQAALHEVLDQVSLTSSDERVKITVVVTNAAFSPLYSNTDDPSAPNAVFRKEISLECEVQHYETLKV